jgi:predicted RNA-binding Zn-ribbon protein involved in translation (DUF1610 family)
MADKYCGTGNTFIDASTCKVKVLSNKTPLALDVPCPECGRVFKSLPRRKDGTVYVSVHAVVTKGIQLALPTDTETGSESADASECTPVNTPAPAVKRSRRK